MPVFKKGTKAYSMFNYKCPRCHTGDLYPTGSWSFKQPFTMHHHCPVCQQKYELESGFYWGSMYVSYALSGGWMLGSFGFCFFLLGLSAITSLVVATVGVFGLYVLIFRTARAIWINFFVSYDPEKDPDTREISQ